MGTGFDLDKEAKEEYKEAIEQIGRLLVFRSKYPWLLFDFIFSLTPSYWKQKSVLKILHGVSETVLKRKTCQRAKKENCESIKKKLAMLDLLLSLKDNDGLIDDEGIREEVDTFIFAVRTKQQ